MRLRRAYSLLLVVVLWEALGRSGWVEPVFLPPLTGVLASLFGLLQSGELLGHIRISMLRAFLGFAAAVAVGVPLGLLMGWSRPVERFFDPLISLIYPIPKVAFIPLLIIWLGIGDASKVGVIFLATVFPLLINTYAGVKGTDRYMIWSALSMGATRRELLLRVVLPHTLPAIFTGLRISMALAWALLFVAEMVGASRGLGFLILFSERMLRTDAVFAGILTIAAFGFTFDRLIRWIGGRVCLWHARTGIEAL
ncbi:MAG: ABC transporter permease [Deltaproteobacteria bacterium]|nr:ABC transporter permease [Deltaproteobacteria bacterium]MBI3079126.1 ABC transporter permease [Deltaproteobacteria bacterium]